MFHHRLTAPDFSFFSTRLTFSSHSPDTHAHNHPFGITLDPFVVVVVVFLFRLSRCLAFLRFAVSVRVTQSHSIPRNNRKEARERVLNKDYEDKEFFRSYNFCGIPGAAWKSGEKVKENATGTSRNQMTFGRAIKRASVFVVAEIFKGILKNIMRKFSWNIWQQNKLRMMTKEKLIVRVFR